MKWDPITASHPLNAILRALFVSLCIGSMKKTSTQTENNARDNTCCAFSYTKTTYIKNPTADWETLGFPNPFLIKIAGTMANIN